MNFSPLIILSLLVEAIWESLKLLWKDRKFSFDKFGAIVIGIFLCVMANIDIMQLAGIPFKSKLISEILTGILLSRGSNFIHDLISMFNLAYSNRKN